MPFADVSARSVSELATLTDRVAVVTGAAAGIGARIAQRFAEAGATLLLVDQDQAVTDHAVRLADTTGATVATLVGDVAESATCERAAEQAVSELGGLHVWVNDAGIFPVGPALEISDDDWARCFAVDVAGTFYGCRAAGRRMGDAGGGVIVNIASSLGFRGIPMQAHYVAAKWAVRGLTAALAAEWGPSNVRVVAVAPGLTRSPGMLDVMADVDANSGADPGSTEAAFAATIPARRLAETDDIARAVLFAATDLGGFFTGSTLLADGGEVYSAGATASS